MSSSHPTAVHYELVFEGASDASLDTVWNIKLILMADLGLSVSKTKSVFEKSPVVLRRATQEDELRTLMRMLQKAGAVVCIRKRSDRSVAALKRVPHVTAGVASKRNPLSTPQAPKKSPATASTATQSLRSLGISISEEELNGFFAQLQRLRAINLKRFRIVDGVETERPTKVCRRDLLY